MMGRFGVSLLMLLLLVMPSAAEDETSSPGAESLAEAVFTGTGEAGTGSVGLRVGYYDQPDSGDGNPFLDEKLSVLETVFIADYNVNDRLSTYGMFSMDIVTSASIGRLDDYPEQTGASGDFYFGLDGGVNYELAEDRRVGGFLATSFERDYWSVGFGGNMAVDLFQANTNIDFAANYFYDTIDVIRFNGDEDESPDDRHTFTSTLTLRQLLDRRSFGELGGTFTHQAGFLETSYNGVVILEPGTEPPFPFDNDAEGFEIEEALPNTRNRGAVFARVRRLVFDSTALQVGGSYGFGSWDVRGYSIEPVVYQQLVKDALKLRLRYRYYDQTESEHYDLTLDAGDPRPRHLTQDTDFSDYHAHTIGAKFEWQVDADWLFDVGVDYTIRSDDMDFVFGSIGIRRAVVAPEHWWREDAAADTASR